MSNETVELKEFIGKTVAEIQPGDKDCGELRVRFSDRTVAEFFIDISCCCHVGELRDVVGDFADLIGQPLALAEIVRGGGGALPGDWSADEYRTDLQEGSWSFLKLGGRGGYVTVSWYSASETGYYNEEIQYAITSPCGCSESEISYKRKTCEAHDAVGV